MTFGSEEGIPRSYETQAKKWKKNTSLTVLNQDENGIFTISGLKCKGEINFVEYINVPSIGDIQVPPKNFVLPPNDLHWRHPFFGRNTNTNAVISSTLVEEKVNPEHKITKQKKNKKDKKRQIIDEVSLEDGILKKIKTEPSVSEDKKPYNIDGVRLEDGVLKKIKVESCIPEKKKKHKRKHEES